MQKLLLCLVALVAFAVAEKRIQVRHEDEVRVTDIDRMNYDGLFHLEQATPEALEDKVHIEDVIHMFEASIGPNWRDYVDIDESDSISYLEFIRLSTSVNFLNADLERQEKKTRGFDGDEGYIGGQAQANLCMCHGTFHSAFGSAGGGTVDNTNPFRGVRVLQKGGTYYGNNPYPNGVPQDCVLCEGEVNCRACCHGPCTIGTRIDYTNAVNGMGSTEWDMGLYPCPDHWTFADNADSDHINDISACTVDVDSCADAVALCSCSQKRHLMQTLGCTCLDVMVLCDSCFQAWDAIDKYKHCDCVDYARYYQMDRS